MVNAIAVPYNPFHGPRLAIAVVILCLLAVFARGADEKVTGATASERDRKARVALALASNNAASSIPTAATLAPSPRVKVTSYGDGYRKATANVQPLVMFVGVNQWPVKGAVVASADSFAGVEAPAVVVGYPVADRLLISATLRGDDLTAVEVQKAADTAGKKIDHPPAKDMPAPKPLDWSIRAEPVQVPMVVPTPTPTPKKVGASCPCDKCLCGDACPGCAASAKGTKATVKAVDPRDALVRVRCGNDQGSGTVIWSDGERSVVLTASHVLNSGGVLSVRGNGKTYSASLLGADPAADLAALLVSAELPAVKVAEGDPADGTEVLLVGMTSIWSKGKIERRKDWTGGEVYLLGAGYESDNGDSGGGVFVAGELVGVHCGKVSDTPTSARTPYAAGAKPIRSFLARVFKREGVAGKLVPITIVAVTTPVQAPAPPAVSKYPVAGPTYYYLPSTSAPGGCPGGKCPLPSATGRRGIFR